jgi:hypothetical protein
MRGNTSYGLWCMPLVGVVVHMLSAFLLVTKLHMLLQLDNACNLMQWVSCQP